MAHINLSSALCNPLGAVILTGKVLSYPAENWRRFRNNNCWIFLIFGANLIRQRRSLAKQSRARRKKIAIMAPAAPMTIRGAALRACAGPPPSAARGHLRSGSRRGVPCPRGNAVHSIATHRRVPGPRLVDRGPTAALLVATGVTKSARADLATARASSSGDASGSSGGPRSQLCLPVL